ncbi:MAG: helix-turn-helix domain-containing protein [Prevotella sp.]|nr:helix-turn-helix domain-containing protein [Prevotella sp.]
MSQTGQFISADRFSSSLINDLCQDREGSLWVATDYGLNRFDGYNFQTFIHQPSDSTSLTDNMVVCLMADRQGYLWVGTRIGLDRFDAASETFIHYPFPDGLTPHVSVLLHLRDGRLLVGTAGYGAYLLGDDGKLQPFGDEGPHGFYSRIFEDSQGRLWHCSFDEMIAFNYQGKTTNFRSEYGNPQAILERDGDVFIVCLRGILVYHNGQMLSDYVDMGKAGSQDVLLWKASVGQAGTIYIGTRGHGLYSIAPGQNPRMEDVDISTHGIDMQTAKVSAMMSDRSGNLWLACHRKGLVMLPQRPEQFKNWSFEGQGIRLGSTISSVCEGDGGITWATVQGVGIYGFNDKGRVVSRPSCPDAVEFIFRDKQRRFWVGTDNGLYDYDPLSGRYSQRVTFDCDRFNDMTSDDEGNIYISTFSRGFCIYNPQTGFFRNFSMDDPEDSIRGRLCNNWILAMQPDRKGHLWMATASGVACYDPKGDTFRSYGWMQLLSGMICYSLCETSRGDILIGTDRGLYMYTPGHDEAVPFIDEAEQEAGVNDVLKDKIVDYVVETNDGDIWCSTSMGVWQYDTLNHEFIGHVAGNGLVKKEYIMNVGLHTDDDRVFFGHNDGLTVFSPRELKITHQPLSDTLRLTAFRVGDQYVTVSSVLNDIRVTDGKPLSNCINFTLSYLDHTVTLAFSQFNFETAMNVSLEYRVNNDEWVRQQEGKNEITLAHLQPGTYRMEVRACQGGDCSPSRMVVITVRSPWYRSTTAYIIYFLLAVLLLGLIGVLLRRQANRQLDEEKMKFLINATHDIRSPLTIILSALKKLKTPAGHSLTGEAVDTIERNSQRILSLVNQILDVRKIDKQQMHLHCRETDMVQFVAGITKMFDFNARERGITLAFQHEGIDRLPAWVDRSQFDKVITNLLSNAFKYTQDGGEITIVLGSKASLTKQGEAGEGSLFLKVLDTGVGLDSDTLRHVFDRFYQGSNSRRMKVEGTGIGLNLCKMIVDMHHGTITASNRTDSKQGSVFTVTLPMGFAHLAPEEIEKAEDEQFLDQFSAATVGAGPVPVHPEEADGNSQSSTLNSQSSTLNSQPSTPNPQPSAPNNQPSAPNPQPPISTSSPTRKRVLLVDDDEEIGDYIKQELDRFYKFGVCHNGKDGLKELLTNTYDIVVSDVMMPEMDGFTMLRMIKSNLNLSHLPVIMLTSKSDVANRLEGLEHGADAFLAKPFDMDELHLTIENLIKGRRHLKGKFSGAQQQTDKLEQPEVKGNDEMLMERVMKAVNKNLDDSDFNVETLCQEVGISRAQLHRKMKELTGLSTSEFIRNIRLEQAARLLKEKKINVTQVAYTVGFSNLAHFSTIFRKHFGVAPSEYAQKE